MTNTLTRFLAVALLLNPSSVIRAQSTEDSVRAVVQGALEQVATRDTVSTSRHFAPGAVLVLVSHSGDSTILRTIPIKAIVTSLTAGPQRREQLRNPAVVVQGGLATVRAAYVFYFDATLHHCGDAMYDLVRSQGRWLITAIRQTDHRAGCIP